MSDYLTIELLFKFLSCVSESTLNIAPKCEIFSNLPQQILLTQSKQVSGKERFFSSLKTFIHRNRLKAREIREEKNWKKSNIFISTCWTFNGNYFMSLGLKFVRFPLTKITKFISKQWHTKIFSFKASNYSVIFLKWRLI